MKAILTKTLILACFLLFFFANQVLASPHFKEPDHSATIVARVNFQEITLAEVDRLVRADLRSLEEQIYDLRRKALDQLVIAILLEEEAEKQGVSLEELQEQFMDGVTVEQGEVDKIFADNRGKFLDQNEFEAREYIRNTVLQGRKRAAYEIALNGLLEKATIKVELAYPESLLVHVNTDGDPSLGNHNAAVTIVEFADFECPYCDQSRKILGQILDLYGEDVRLVHKDLPILREQGSFNAAIAAQCAHTKGKFWEYYHLLFDNKDHSIQALKMYSAQLGLDVVAFESCMNLEFTKQAIEADIAFAREAGVRSPPTFFINGRVLRGSAPLARFRSIIDEELTKTTK